MMKLASDGPCVWPKVTLLVSGWTGTMSYPPNSKIKTSEPHEHRFLQREQWYNYCQGPKQDPQGFIFSHFSAGRKVVSCVWLFTWGMLQNKDPHRSYSSRPISHMVVGGWPKGGATLCLDVPELLSFFPSVPFCVWASNLPRAKMNHRFILLLSVNTNKR